MIHERKPNIFPAFKELVNNDVTGKKILDFGGNRGNLIHFSEGEILEEDYTCLDVSQDALIAGAQEFPNANWVWYDRYNQMYNTTGTDLLFPTFIQNFDYVWSFSVVTHTDLTELVKILQWMKTLNAKIMVSFLDISSRKHLNFFYGKRIEKYGRCIDFRSNNMEDYFYLVDHNQVIMNSEEYRPFSANEFLAFYNMDFLKAYLNDHCIACTIEKPKNSSFPFIIL